MSESVENFSSNQGESKSKPCCEGIKCFVEKHPEIFCLSLLALACLLFLFVGLGYYPFLDVDETRYAIMARDLTNSASWNNLMLNHVPFLEKPPMYFWLVGKSIDFFGEFNQFAVRFPIALLASFLTFFTYFLGKKVISRKFGMYSALVLLSSVFFLIFSHVAILDMVLTVFIASSIYCGFLSHFCEDNNKKYAWWYFYLFAGLAFLSKGLLGLAIPVVVMFVYNMLTKTLKEFFKPANLLPGLIIFLLIILPWHMIMYYEYGNTFLYEYFIRHHFARFIDSASIGRERPLLYFIPIFLVGFLPWSLSFLAFFFDAVKKFVNRIKKAEGGIVNKLFITFEPVTNEQKLILFGWVYFIVTFLLFSTSSTKLPTYILPVFPAAALLTGYLWFACDERKEYEKSVSITTQLLAGTFVVVIFAAAVAFFVYPLFQYAALKNIAVFGLGLAGILMLVRLDTKNARSVFFSYVLTMIFVIALAVSNIFGLIYRGGQDEIVDYANYANNFESQLVTFDFAVKPSAMLKYEDKKIEFITDPNFYLLDEIVSNKYKPTFVIVKNVNMKNPEYAKKIKDRFEMIQTGDRYSLYVKDINHQFDIHKKPKNGKKNLAHLEFEFSPQ